MLTAEERRSFSGAAKCFPFNGNALPDLTTSQQWDEIVGSSAEINFVKGCIDRVAPSEATILISGETGTGKELFARRAHRMSNRRDRPLISINCAAIPDTLLESELFGFEKGAFTGAVSRQEGRLAQANGGTIFLDEIGDLSLSAQAKLLRVLEEKAMQPLGAQSSQAIDIRIVAATNRDLEQLAIEEKFRQDLFFRINVIHVRIPPLRERTEDIPLIAEEFLQMLSLQYRRPVVTLAASALAYLRCQPWIGNARELRNVIERAFLLSDSEYITKDDVTRMCHLATGGCAKATRETPIKFRAAPASKPEHRTNRSRSNERRTNYSENAERNLVFEALEEAKWNKSKAARLLRCSRMTIHRKVVYYDLRRPDIVSPEQNYGE